MTIGPLIDRRATAKVRGQVADAIAQGATLRPADISHPAGDRFLRPSLLTGVAAGKRKLHEETFGLLAPVVKFETEAQAISLTNESETGLAAYLFTRDHARLWRVAEALEVGMVGANSGSISTEVAPFGGIKLAGLGREGPRHGLEEYLELKYLCISVAQGG